MYVEVVREKRDNGKDTPLANSYLTLTYCQTRKSWVKVRLSCLVVSHNPEFLFLSPFLA